MTHLFVLMNAAFALGVIAAAAWPGRSGARVVSLGAALVGCACAITMSAVVLCTHTTWSMLLPGLLRPLTGASVKLDPLAAWFLFIVGFTGVPTAIYGQGYLRHLDGQRAGRLMHASFNVFLAAMCLVTLADHVFVFLASWELMALSSYLLVVAGPASDDTSAAGMWYATMTHVGFVALLAAFLVLAHGGPLGFADLRVSALTLSPRALSLVFALALLAFGSKAGLVPLHVWLPRAHPAAPSHVSALMSAAMVALGIYGFTRVFFDLLPAGPAWWGGVLLTMGIATAITGVLYTVADTHLKRVLAYSTIENMGLVAVSLGFALQMRGDGYTTLAALGVIIALLHTLNHAVFKSLLFLGAGAVVHSTHATSLEAYGGLIKRMPYTAALCLIGALALAALPPFNGFPSEWLTFQLLVAGARHTKPELAILLPLAIASIALVAGLAAVSAVRIFGITFLALPRTPGAAAAAEASPAMRLAMIVPAIGCVILGVAPALALSRLVSVAATLGLTGAPVAIGAALRLPINNSQLAPFGVAAVLGVATLALGLVLRLRVTRARLRHGPAWNCGRLVHSARTEYTAAAFAEPLKRVFTGFYRPRQEVTIEVDEVSPYFVRSIAFRSDLAPWMEQALYEPVIRGARWVSLQTRRLQAGSIHLYLALLPVALVVLLFLAHWIR